MRPIDHTLKQTIMRDFGTPCAVIDLDKVEQNIQTAQRLCAAQGLANRPHIKTHGSVGCVAKARRFESLC